MTSTKVSRRSSSACDRLFKADCPRAVDRWISYFGETPVLVADIQTRPGCRELLGPSRLRPAWMSQRSTSTAAAQDPRPA